MDFEQTRRKSENEKNYHIENLKISRDFSKELLLEMKELVRSIVLFGSNTHDTLKKDSDIDIMVVLDNVSVFVSDELREAYKIITAKLNASVGKNKIHLMTINLSDLWDACRKGDPIIINVLRYGQPIFDRDLIDPLQYLLEIGRIRPSIESIHNYSARAETLIDEIDKHMQNSVLDAYYSLVDMTHAVLMTKGVMPPSPKEMPSIFAKEFKGKPLEKYSKDLKEVYALSKEVEKRGKKISGSDVDKLRKNVVKIISDMRKFIDTEVSKKDFDL